MNKTSDCKRTSIALRIIFIFSIYFVFTEAKEQILANLANFAYDPINYEYFKKLNIADLFLGEFFLDTMILL